MKQIETLVFDYGGVIVNIDDASVVKAMESLGVTMFKRLIHFHKIKRLIYQYINLNRGYRGNPRRIVWQSACGKTGSIGQTSEAIQGLSAQQHQQHALAEISQPDEAVGIFHRRAV